MQQLCNLWALPNEHHSKHQKPRQPSHMIEQYKIKPDGFKEIRKQVIIKTIPLGLIALATGIGVSVLNPNGQDNQTNVLPFVISIGLAALVFSIYKGINRQKLLFDSYKLSISDDGITREQSNTPTINIPYSDINSITKDDKGNFSIKGQTATDTIGVSYLIENHEQLEQKLSQIRPIETTSKPSFDQKYRMPFVFLTLACMATVYISANKILVGISGAVVSINLIWSFFQIQKNKNIDSKTKRGSYWTILVLFSIIMTMLFKLTT